MSNQLCEDMIVEIFTRLPPKSLLRFRTLSKSLRLCIDSPNFIRVHSIQSQNKLKKLIIIHEYHARRRYHYMYTLHSEGQLSSCSTSTVVTPLKHPFENFGIYGSCDGIICLYKTPYTIKLWNPSIRRQLVVPDSPAFNYLRGFYYTPSVGFGYDRTIEDYKIVMIAHHRTDQAGKVIKTYVYIMKTNTWSEIASPTTTPFDWVRTTPCPLNGTCSWLVGTYVSGGLWEGPTNCYIITFDLSSHVFGTITLPEPNRPYTNITRINGCLGVISSSDVTTWIWVRREDKNTPYWSLFFKSDTKFVYGVERALQLTDDGDLLYSTSHGVQAYNTNDKKKQLRLAHLDNCSIYSMSVCVESLGLLDTGTSYEGSQLRGKKRGRTSTRDNGKKM